MLDKDQINAEFEEIWEQKFSDVAMLNKSEVHDFCQSFYNIGYGNGGAQALEMLRADRLSETVSRDLGTLLR